MKKIYQKRRETLINCLKTNFHNEIKIIGDATGLHITCEFKNIDFSNGIVDKIIEYGVKVYPVENHTIDKGKHRHQIIIGYGNLTNEKIIEGINRLGIALKAQGENIFGGNSR